MGSDFRVFVDERRNLQKSVLLKRSFELLRKEIRTKKKLQEIIILFF